MEITLQACLNVLQEHDLIIDADTSNNTDVRMNNIAYNSQKITRNGLFFCKGNFKEEYLIDAFQRGAVAYISEQQYDLPQMNYIIVANVQKAMALISALFFEYPQNKLHLIGVTGTKGKTTTSYMMKAILDQINGGKTALFSTVDRIVGPNKADQKKSDLTTPESLDLFYDMHRAVQNGMESLVMEVSSQAYKKHRVYNLTFDIGYFLNISPDHIGKNEHPDFADYLFCKSQLVANSKRAIINGQTDEFSKVYNYAKFSEGFDKVQTFSRNNSDHEIPTNYIYKSLEMTLSHNKFELLTPMNDLPIAGEYEINIAGDFNQGNAVAAIILGGIFGGSKAQIQAGLNSVYVPGRMEHVTLPGNREVFVDYAHNYASLYSLCNFLTKENPGMPVTVVLGSPGDKGESRRADFVKVLNEFADNVVFTTDDPGYEDPQAISLQMADDMDNERIKVQIIEDRATAIEAAVKMAPSNSLIILAGKGTDATQKIQGKEVPYETDMVIARRFL